MTKMKMIRRSALFMCFLLLFFCLVPGFQQPARAIAGVDDLAWALLATLAAFGVTITAAGGIDDVGPWIVDRFEDFVDSAGDTLSTVISKIRYGVNKAGDLIGNAYALSYNARFASWLQSTYSLTDSSSISTAISFPVLPTYTGSTVSMMKAYSFGGQNVALAGISDPTYYFAVPHQYGFVPYCVAYYSNRPSGSQPLVRTYNMTYGGSVVTELTDGYIFETSWGYGNVSSPTSRYPVSLYGNWLIFPTLEDALLTFDSFVSSSSAPDITINTGSIDIPQVGDYSDDDGIIIDGIGSWGDTLTDIANKVKGGTIPDSVPLNPGYTITDEGSLSDSIVETQVDYGPASNYPSPGLADVFPFCIPFDIYHFFEALAAEPVAPHFEIPFQIDGLVDYTFVLDLSDFESVAQVMRTMELLLFCVGLALVTRNLIRG